MIAAVARAVPALIFLLVAGCSAYLGESRVAETDFRATLSGASEVPPAASRAWGYFEAVYRPSTKVLEYRLNLVGLSSPITLGYLQGPAAPDENAEQVAPINIAFYDNTIWDGVTLTPQQAEQVLAGRWYVNVLTINYPGGELRGQIVPLKK